jgi:hypothetical protein
MRTLRWIGLTWFTVVPALAAQSSELAVEAGLGYARVFDGGGVSLEAAVDRPMTAAVDPVQHALGLSFWYAQTDIASNAQSSDPSKRDLLGLGVRYRLGWQQCCGSLHPFLAVPVQVLHSSIQDTSSIVAELASHSVPTPPPEVPSQDQPGSAWGWGAGLELGLGLALADNLSGQTGLQGIYHDIYSGVSSHTAWTWHLGLSYGF